MSVSAQNDYFIKEGYVINPVADTMDDISGGTYWNKSRLHASRYYQYHVYQHAISLIKKNGITNIADVGCGPATKLAMIHKALPNVKITGIDQKHPIDFCKSHYSFGNWIVDDFENPTAHLSTGEIGLIICADVIEHLQDPDKLLNYIKKISTNKTLILLSTPERDCRRGKAMMHSPHKQHVREWNAHEFQTYIQSQGFLIDYNLCLPDFKLTLHKNFILQEIGRIKKGLPKKNNQALLIRKA